MQQYPPPPMQSFYPASQPVQSYPQAPPQRPSRKYPAPCIKYPPGHRRSTSAVWGGSTHQRIENDSDDDSDDETVGPVTTTSIASSRSRAPGNKPTQHRRVVDWVHDTSHHSSKFKSPFVPRTATSIAHSSVPRSTERHVEFNGHRANLTTSREPPPIWVPQQTAHRPLTHAVSQPILFQPQQPPMQYTQSVPPMMWTVPAPAPPPPQGPMRGNGHVQFVAPPRTVIQAN
ncbi:hypothetical protein B0H19DRAFT_1055192 [Mycena capillaripes]|nr:hypothetical protein B0H19DRAFT_1055192 [Mycena capillaripes]